jgi:hypothetical protein
MNRKELHQEIEQLIHSIKLHYHQINEGMRIPTIELELITAKIRKLHEKSILYKHLHFIEEQGLVLTRAQSTSRASAQVVSSSSSSGSSSPVTPSVEAPVSTTAATIAAPAFAPSAPALEQASASEPTPTPTPTPSAAASVPESSPRTVTPSAEAKASGQDLNSFVSFNDRYVFISKLFWGNADEYKRGITSINAAGNLQDAEGVVRELGIRFKWDSDSDAVKLFHTIVQRMFSR